MSEHDAKFLPPKDNKAKIFRLGNIAQHGWVEDSFIFDKHTGRQTPLPRSNTYIGNSFSLKYFRYTIIFIVLFFVIILGRVTYLQIIKGGMYLSLAEGNRQRVIPIPSERGLIFDRNGIQLTKNIPGFSLALVPQDLPKDVVMREFIVKRLATLTHTSEEEIRQILEEYGSYSFESIIIQEDISYDEALLIHIEAADLPGISIYRGSKRLYNDGLTTSTDAFINNEVFSFSHIIGYQGKLDREELDRLYPEGYLPSDTIGKIGVEKVYEKYLRGSYGKRRVEVNAYGREQTTIAEETPTPGSHVRLAVDARIQRELEQIIRDELKRQGKHRASGIVMNPNNGEVLALVSYPSFDNNDFSGGISFEAYEKYINDENNPLFNRAIGGTYPSGSTIKPLIAAAALEEGVIQSGTTISSVGGIYVGPWFFPDWMAGGHGLTDVRRSIAWSINTFYYYIGGGYQDFDGLGIDKIRQYLRAYGFGERLGIDLIGEAEGFVPSVEWKNITLKEPWYIGDTYNMSIGQGYFLSTPLQIAAMTGAVANGGTLYKPRIATHVIDAISGQEVIAIEPEIIENSAINTLHFETVAAGMHDCVLYGSCRRLSTLPFSVAGKTGTAQWHNEKENHAWFTSFAPYEDPEIVVTILVEEGGQGSAVAIPIAHKFYDWWWRYRSGLVD